MGQDWTIGNGWGLGEGFANFDDSTNGGISQSIVFTASKTYKVDFEITSGSGSIAFLSSNGVTTYVSYATYGVGTHSVQFKYTTGSGFNIFSSSFLGGAFSITNISVKEVGQNWNNVGTQNALNYNEFTGTNVKIINDITGSGIGQNVLQVGKKYEIEIDVETIYGNGFKIYMGNEAYITEIGKQTVQLTSTGINLYLYRSTNTPYEAQNGAIINSISVKEVLSVVDFTIFEVSKINQVSNSLFGYYHLGDGSYINMGTNSSGNYEVSVSDGSTVLAGQTSTVDTGKYHIGVLRKVGEYLNFNYYDSTSSVSSVDSNPAFEDETSYQQEKFTIGCLQSTDGLNPSSLINTKYLDGNFQEVIVYDRKLNDTETANVVNYLNNKYKIY